jgi:ankyrin repeat protein
VCTYSVLQAGVDVNDGSPVTPLTLAADKGLTEFINCLLEAGADANIPNEVSFILIFRLLVVAVV